MFEPIVFNEDVCNGCNNCVKICPTDVFEENPVRGKPPIINYPDQCTFCGVCWDRCPSEGDAVTIYPPLPMQVSILRGQHS